MFFFAFFNNWNFPQHFFSVATDILRSPVVISIPTQSARTTFTVRLVGSRLVVRKKVNQGQSISLFTGMLNCQKIGKMMGIWKFDDWNIVWLLWSYYEVCGNHIMTSLNSNTIIKHPWFMNKLVRLVPYENQQESRYSEQSILKLKWPVR